jgi:hypothetical protein
MSSTSPAARNHSQLSFLDAAKEGVGPSVHMRLAGPNREALLHHHAERELVDQPAVGDFNHFAYELMVENVAIRSPSRQLRLCPFVPRDRGTASIAALQLEVLWFDA